MTVSIVAQHLRKTFGATLAVDDMNLNIASGEIYGLVGSDGAGKTTTMRLLVGALKPDSGDASICGYSVGKQTEQVRAQLGYLSQRFSFYEDLTVLENIRFFAEVRGLSRQEWLPRCMEILSFVGLESFKDRRAGQLSGGMKQKLGLASALVTRPKVLLLDEPTTGVDPVTRQDFWQLLIRLVSAPLSLPPSGTGGEQEEGGVAIILSTPYMDEAARCHRVGFMRLGRMIAEGTPSQLLSTLEGYIVEVRGRSLPSMRQAVEKIKGVEDVRAFGDKLHLRVVPGGGRAESVIAALAEAFPARAGARVEARLVPPTLEDVFISLSGSKD
ncbi:MAG: ABC transporter ATP-binding protein [Anaerolineales bacterium]